MSKPQGYLSLTVNGHTLTGTKKRGRWSFVCDSWPTLAEQHKGADSATAILDEFMRRCLQTAVTVRTLYEKAVTDE